MQVDRCFDILNSHSPLAKGYKRPISQNTIEQVQNSLDDIMAYFSTLTTSDGVLLTKHRRKTFVIGFQTAAASFLSVSHQLFQLLPESKFFLAYRLNQDHLESFFSKIRQRGGWNNNPDAQQFASALKSLLVKNEITPSSSANCLELDPSDESYVKFCGSRRSRVTDDEGDLPDWCSVEIATADLNRHVADIVEYIGKMLL